MTPKKNLRTIRHNELRVGLADALEEIKRLRNIALAQANEIEWLQRERDALLREHEVGDNSGLSKNATFFFKHAEWKAAHDEATRVLAEGAKK